VSNLDKERLLRSTILAGVFAVSMGAAPAFGQDADQVVDCDDPANADAAECLNEASPQAAGADIVTVTGSRIRRDAFTSTRPLQVVDAQAAAALGSIDAADLIQESTTVSGQQITDAINTSLSGSNAAEIPPEGGVGSQNVGLRGLSAERTLVLLNGRRLAPAGVGGAPTRPDLSTIPTAIVERVEILTGGASSIYGADAVAGVVNIITRQDFEGFEVDAFKSYPLELDGSAGEETRLSFVAGASNNSGNVTFSGEFFERNAIQIGDLGSPEEVCQADIRDVFDANGDLLASKMTTCSSGFFDNFIARNDSGDFWAFHEGTTDPSVGGFSDLDGNGDILPNWSRSALARQLEIYGQVAPINFAPFMWLFDVLPNGQTPVQKEFGEFNDQDERLDSDFRQGVRRFSFIGTGEYDIDLGGFWQPTVFFEGSYSNRQTRQRAVGEQIVAEMPGFIPVLPADRSDFQRDGAGDPVFVQNPLNPFKEDITVIKILDNDFDQVRDAELETIRLTGGVRDDFDTILGVGSNWGMELFGTYDRNLGFQGQDIFYRPAVFAGTQMLFQDADGRLQCGLPPQFPFGNQGAVTSPSFNGPDALDPDFCVPLDFLNPTVLNEDRISTEEELEFIRGTRTNRTVVEQAVFGGFISGDLVELPAGPLGLAVGAEYRIDKIDSINDVTVTKGLQASEAIQSEGNAQGETWQRDFYAEVRVPLLAGQMLAEELTVEGSVRHTEEKNFGGETTYSIAGIWRPTDWLTFRGDYATAFRAPNLREQFIAQNASGTSSTGIDPCRVPTTARADDDGDGVTDRYDPTGDTRDPNLLAQCVASGADPTALALFNTSVTSIPVFTSGSVQLKPETAESYTGGFVLSPDVAAMPYINKAIDSFSFAATYWNIEVEDTVEELSPGSIIGGCFDGQSPTLASDLCNRVERLNTGDPSQNVLRSVTIDFINRGLIQTDGMDLNLRMSRDVSAFDQDITFIFDSSNSYLFSYKEQLTPGDPFDQDVGEDYRPRWQMDHTLTALWENWTFRWQAQWTSQVGTGGRGTSGFTGFQGVSSWAQLLDVQGGSIPPSQVSTYQFIDDYWEHNLSAVYSADTWSATLGIANVADNRTKIDDSSGIGNRNGFVSGGRYDTTGRRVFVRLNKEF